MWTYIGGKRMSKGAMKDEGLMNAIVFFRAGMWHWSCLLIKGEAMTVVASGVCATASKAQASADVYLEL